MTGASSQSGSLFSDMDMAADPDYHCLKFMQIAFCPPSSSIIAGHWV